MSGLDVRYDLGVADIERQHPLLGRRMPDLEVTAAGAPRRVFTLLHAARPVLLDFGGGAARACAPWADRVRVVDARYDGAWVLPVAAPAAVLVRPDGYVAWVGDAADDALAEALAKWFGAPGAD